MIGQPPERRSQKQSRAGVAHIPANRTEMAPAAARRVVALRKPGKSPALADEEQRIIDAVQWLEILTGNSRCNASLVAALAGINSPTTAIDWCRVLHQRRAIAYEGMQISLKKAGRKLANQLDGAPTLEELHRRVVAGQWGPYARALQSLIDRYPDAYSRQEFAAAADIPFESFPFEHSIRSLLRQGLIKTLPAGMLSAAAVLFDGPRS
jgi:hypothetical protein